MAGDDPVYVCCSNHDSSSHETLFSWRQLALSKRTMRLDFFQHCKFLKKISTEINSQERLMGYVKKLVVSIILHHCLLKLLYMICCSSPLWYWNTPTQTETARAQAGEWGLCLHFRAGYDNQPELRLSAIQQ